MKIMSQYPDKHFDLAIVDPPYGKADGCKRTGGTWAKKHGKKITDWDIAPDQDYFKELMRVSKFQIIWGGNYFTLPPSRNFIIWKKYIPENFTLAMCEYAWTNIKGNAKVFIHHSFNPSRIHPCEKPKALYKWLLLKYAKQDYKILDTHLGSGSIAIACNEMGFDLTASEIDADYFAAACSRVRDANKQTELFKEVS